VRNLREELTFAARDMHRRGAAPPRSSAAPTRDSKPGHQNPPRGNGGPPPRRGARATSAWDAALGRSPAREGARESRATRPAGARRPPGRGGPGLRGQSGWRAWPPGGSAGLILGLPPGTTGRRFS
jgi:hypothetical protein